MTLGTIDEESTTLGPGMSASTIGTNYTSKTTTRADIHGRPFDVDSKAGIPGIFLVQARRNHFLQIIALRC